MSDRAVEAVEADGTRAPGYAAVRREPVRPWAWAALAAIVVIGLALRLPGLGDPVAGYHSFNEAFYLGIARRYLSMGLAAPWIAPLELNNPPLFPFLLRVAMSVFGTGVGVGRALSVAAALGATAAVFALGRRLYGTVAGLGAALVVALAPGSVLVGRNIQIESTLVLLVALATWAWVVAVDEDRVSWALAAGALAGLAVLTKTQGLVVVPVLALVELVRTRSLRRMVDRVPLAALGAFGATALPWQVYNLLKPASAAALAVKAAEFSVPSAGFWDIYFAREWLWMLSPALTVAVIAGVAVLARRRSPADLLVLGGLAANVLFYTVYHHHSYYIYNAIPFAALAAAALLVPLARRSVRAAVAVLCAAALVLVPFAMTELAGKKLGYWTSEQIAVAAAEAGVPPSQAALAVAPLFRASWEPALLLNGRGLRIVSNPLVPGELPSGTRLLTLDPHPRAASADATPLVRLSDEHVMPVFFGYAVDQSHDALFYFAVDQPAIVRVGPPWSFGYASRTEPAQLWVSVLSPAYAAKVRAASEATPPAP